MKKYILFILILLLGTSINIAPEEGNFDFTRGTEQHPVTGFASWIDKHHLASERDKVSNGRVGSEAELFAILDSGLAFQMPLPLVGANEAMNFLEIAELKKAEELAIAEKLAQEKLIAEKKEEENLKNKKEEKLLTENTIDTTTKETEKEEIKQEIIEEKAEEKIKEAEQKPIALEKPAEKETTDSTSSEAKVVDTATQKPAVSLPIELQSDDVDMTQYSVIRDNNSYEAIFTLANKGDDVQAGQITFSMSFEDGRTIPFTGYVGSFRFKMQVPKTYTLNANAQMLDHAKVAAPRLITIYLLNNREEVFFRKNIMITN